MEAQPYPEGYHKGQVRTAISWWSGQQVGFLVGGPCGVAVGAARGRLPHLVAVGLRSDTAGVDELWRRDSRRRASSGTLAASAHHDAKTNAIASTCFYDSHDHKFFDTGTVSAICTEDSKLLLEQMG